MVSGNPKHRKPREIEGSILGIVRSYSWDETMFVGLYHELSSLLEQDTPMPHMDGIDKAGSCDVYDLKLEAISIISSEG